MFFLLYVINLFFFFLHFFILKPVFFRGFIVFRFELHRLVSRNKSLLLSKMGYFNADSSFRFLALNTLSLGLWLNKGAFFKNAPKFAKYLVSFFINYTF